MDGSRRKRKLCSHEGPPSLKVFRLHTEQNLKHASWHRVHRGYLKVIKWYRGDIHVQCVY
jgi:hypothetical protein